MNSRGVAMSETDLEEFLSRVRVLVGQLEARLRPEPRAVNLAGAAERLGVSAKHVSRMIRRSLLRTVDVGGARRITLAEIDRVLRESPDERPVVQPKRAPRYDAAAASARLAALRKKA